MVVPCSKVLENTAKKEMEANLSKSQDNYTNVKILTKNPHQNEAGMGTPGPYHFVKVISIPESVTQQLAMRPIYTTTMLDTAEATGMGF